MTVIAAEMRIAVVVVEGWGVVAVVVAVMAAVMAAVVVAVVDVEGWGVAAVVAEMVAAAVDEIVPEATAAWCSVSQIVFFSKIADQHYYSICNDSAQ